MHLGSALEPWGSQYDLVQGTAPGGQAQSLSNPKILLTEVVKYD